MLARASDTAIRKPLLSITFSLSLIAGLVYPFVELYETSFLLTTGAVLLSAYCVLTTPLGKWRLASRFALTWLAGAMFSGFLIASASLISF